jgi:DNA polymerase-3 subunit epsilon/ATP-dependent DNA helicase DinG
VEQSLVEVCRGTRGRTLALFTSHAALRTAYSAVQPPLEEEGILVLGQGIDGGPKKVLNNFRANPNSVLLGAAALWEGVDVVGRGLSVLVIARLPFSVPTDPVFSARAELFDDPFNEYLVPQAVLKFKQGFGRLIRSRSDRGVVILLDKRLQTKSYGMVFLESLPKCTVRTGKLRQMAQEVLRWLGD